MKARSDLGSRERETRREKSLRQNQRLHMQGDKGESMWSTQGFECQAMGLGLA